MLQPELSVPALAGSVALPVKNAGEVATAIIERDGRFLMVEEEAEGRIVINQPAGHLEQGETLFEAVKREVPSVSMVTPTVNSRSQLVFGNMNWNTSVQGVSEQYPDVRKWTVQTGGFFTEPDVRTAARVIVIGQRSKTVVGSRFPKGESRTGEKHRSAV